MPSRRGPFSGNRVIGMRLPNKASYSEGAGALTGAFMRYKVLIDLNGPPGQAPVLELSRNPDAWENSLLWKGEKVARARD